MPSLFRARVWVSAVVALQNICFIVYTYTSAHNNIVLYIMDLFQKIVSTFYNQPQNNENNNGSYTKPESIYESIKSATGSIKPVDSQGRIVNYTDPPNRHATVSNPNDKNLAVKKHVEIIRESPPMDDDE